MQIYKLKNQVAKTYTYAEKKQKTSFTKEEEEHEHKQKSRESFARTVDKKPMTPIKRGKVNPEISLSRPPKANRSTTNAKRDPYAQMNLLNPQLQVFNPLIRNNMRKPTN